MNETGVLGRAEFLKIMDGLKLQFDDIKANVDSREKKFDSDLKELMNFLQNEPLIPVHDGESLDESLLQPWQELKDFLDWAVKDWAERAANYERNTEFRNDHGDSLLVYVYGLVNTGKSSLGNFIAHGNHDPSNEFITMSSANNNAPKFFVRSVASGKLEEIEYANRKIAQMCRFHTNFEEATDRIQWFKLPGLTWVDSPGLGSVHQSNGKLAREYLDSADLVLVTVNHGQPGRRSEIDELQKLINRGKPVMVLITRTDEIHWDEDEDGNLVNKLIMKPDQDRREAVEWVASEIEKLTGGSVGTPKIVTISVKYAEVHPGFDGARNSGLSELFEQLREIAVGRGVTSKKEVPEKNLRNFISKVVGEDDEFGAGKIVIRLKELRQSLLELRKSLKTDMNQAEQFAEQKVAEMIDKEVEKHREGRDNEGLRKATNQQFHEIVEKHLVDAANKIASSVDAEVRALVPHNFGPAPEFRAVKTIVSHTVRRHVWWGALIGGMAGGVSGFVVAGPAGAAVGVGAGATVGKAVYGKRDKTIVQTVELGDNAREVALELRNHYCRLLREKANKIVRLLSEDILGAMDARTENVIERIEEFRNGWSCGTMPLANKEENP